LQLTLIGEHTWGALIPGSGGLRKIRWRSNGKGKRGGLRVIYYYIASDAQIYFLTLYRKAEVKDLTRNEIKALKALIEAELK